MWNERRSVRGLCRAWPFAVLVLLAIPAAAQVQPPSYFHYVIPGVASTDGAQGSHWQTDSVLTAHDAAVDVTQCYYAAIIPGQATSCAITHLNAGQSLVFTDIVKTLFNAPGTFGMVTLTTSGDPTLLEARAKTYNTITTGSYAGGTAGTGLQAIRYLDLMQYTFVGTILGTYDVNQFRQNLTIISTTDPITMTVRLKDTYGGVLSTATISQGAWSVTQTKLADPAGNAAFTTTPQNDMVVELLLTSGTFATGYLSTSDNVTNNPSVSYPITASNPMQYVMASAFANGASNTLWQTALTIKSNYNNLMAFQVTFLKPGQGNFNTSEFATDFLFNQENRTMGNVLATMLHEVNPSSGALRVSNPANQSMFVTSSTYNKVSVDGVPGTFGASIKGLTEDDGASNKSGQANDHRNPVDASINGLVENDRFRTNLNIVSVAPGNGPTGDGRPSTYTLTLYDKNGTSIGSLNGSIKPDEWQQINRVISTVTGTTSDNARVMVHVDPDPVSGDGYAPKLLVGASVIDNLTGSFDYRTAFRIERLPLPPKVTGEQYVSRWLDVLREQYFYLSNSEVRCMINGNCGTRSYAPDMAAILVRASENSTGLPASTIEQALRDWVDGAPANGDLDARYDPLNTSMVNRKVGFYFPPANASIFTLSASDMQSWYGVVRAFLVSHSEAHPDQYGGSPQSGPNLGHNPTWTTQDPN